jgi:hypothetical protein
MQVRRWRSNWVDMMTVMSTIISMSPRLFLVDSLSLSDWMVTQTMLDAQVNRGNTSTEARNLHKV